MARMVHLRDTLMASVGTDEAFIAEKGHSAMHWRKPLRIDEINRLAPTPDVRARVGRP